MKKTRTSYDDAPEICKEFFGEVQPLTIITELWHEYGKVWRHYHGFADWLANNI